MRRLLGALAAALLAGCASLPPPNPPLAQHAPRDGYRFLFSEADPPEEKAKDRLFLILSFSGGGTRAAALAFGVLEALRDTMVDWQGRRIRLLDEVDVISSVSGGSFTAAYYALRAEETFKEFPGRFLYRRVQTELLHSALTPSNWSILAHAAYGRSDVAAEFYDREVFGGAKYADLIAAKRRPFVILNATDMTAGTQFQFVQDQFDLLCSDLAGVPIGRAAASSSAFPGLLTPLTFTNYAGTCGYQPPSWVARAAEDHSRRINPRRTARALYWQSLAAHDPQKGPARPFLHLVDGGVSDNIGLRGPIDAIASTDPSWSVLRRINLQRVEKLVVIAVNAATGPKTGRDAKPDVPGLVDVVTTAATVPLDNYSFDTIEQLQLAARDSDRDARLVADCNRLSAARGEQCALRLPGAAPVAFYPIQVAFEYLAVPEERDWFRALPTSFELPEDTVDRLREVGRRLLREDPEFRRLLGDLGGAPR